MLSTYKGETANEAVLMARKAVASSWERGWADFYKYVPYVALTDRDFSLGPIRRSSPFEVCGRSVRLYAVFMVNLGPHHGQWHSQNKAAYPNLS
jgi:hypothetical protein